MKLLLMLGLLSWTGWLGAHPSDYFHAEASKDSTNQLRDQTDTLELRFLVWGCECPNWIAVTDYEKAEISGGMIDYCMYLESGNQELKLPADFDPETQRIRVVGRFYEKTAYPAERLPSEETVRKARIFRVSTVEIYN